MRRKIRNSLILTVLLVVILGLGFGVYRIFFVPRPLKMRKLESMHIVHPRSNYEWGWGIALVDVEYDDSLGLVYDNGNTYQKGNSYAQLRDIFLRIFADEDEEIGDAEEHAESGRDVPAGGVAGDERADRAVDHRVQDVGHQGVGPACERRPIATSIRRRR